MKTFINNHGLLCFSAQGKDFIFSKGELATLPEDDEHVKTLLSKGYITEKKQIKTNKNG